MAAALGTVGSSLARPADVRAGSDGDVVLGSDNAASSTTKVTNSINAGDVLWGASSSSGTGVLGTSATGSGVWGNGTAGGTGVQGSSTSGIGVRGTSTSGNGVLGKSGAADQAATVGWSYGGGGGVLGYSGGGLDALPAMPAKTGVYGRATEDSSAHGVHGQTTSGRGVYGQATSGAGLYGYATTGYALRTSGRLRIDKASGVATIFAGNTVQVVTPGLDVTASSFVLLTPKGDLGTRRLWYTTDTTNDRFTIRVSSAVTADLKVGWLLLD